MAVTANRRYVLAGVVVALGLVTGLILLDVLATILFALTVAYVLIPVQRWLVRRGLSKRVAAVSATIIGFLGALAVFSPIFVSLYLRRAEVIEILESLPAELSVTLYGSTFTLEAAEVQTWAIAQIQSVGLSVAAAAPELAVKFALFVLLLFALVLKGDAAGRAAIAPVPHEYRDVAYALARRARETLYAIYVLQLATSVATLLIGYPLFWLLGYESAFTLAMIAAILQFVPIIGPSLLVVPIALYHVAMGELLAAVLVAVLGIGLVAWLPDVTVRPRLANETAGLPGSLYFVGFTGGLFTMGAIGIVVGPLIVAVFVEAVDLLADEVNGPGTFTDFVPAEALEDEVDVSETIDETPDLQPTDGADSISD